MKLPIGENIRRLRLAKGLTQEQLAALLGVSCQSVSRWELVWQGDIPGAIACLREAMRVWPNDDGLCTELALALGKTGQSDHRREAIALLEQVLQRSTNEKLRSTTRAGLCYLYLADGQQQKALALGRTLPHIWESREVLLPGLVAPADRAAATERCLNIARQVLEDVAAGREIPFALGYNISN